MRLWTVGGVLYLVLAKSLDTAITLSALHTGRATEANPLGAWAYLTGQDAALWALSGLAVLVAVVGIELAARTASRTWGSYTRPAVYVAGYGTLGSLWLAVGLYNTLRLAQAYGIPL